MACRGQLDQDKAAQEASRSLLQESWCKAEAEGKGVKQEGRGGEGACSSEVRGLCSQSVQGQDLALLPPDAT